jgi:hypothetical protein
MGHTKENIVFDLTGELWAGALIGGLLPDALRIAKARHKGLPGWVGSIGFWIGLIVLLALGILAVAITNEYIEQLTFLTALGIGYAAPDAISTIVSKQGAPDSLLAEQPTLLDWWAR